MKNIEYITAGAGSGKTYRLTHTLADILKSGKVSPSEVIVTTFTKAAAAEIKDRARQVLLDEGLVLKAAQLDSAAIGTIHSVAQMLVNTFWYELGASPNQEVITDEDKRLYRNQSLGKMLQEEDFSGEMKVIRAYMKEFYLNKYGRYIDSEFWASAVEMIVGKMSYYQIDNLKESLTHSLNQVTNLTALDAGQRDLMKRCIEAVFKLAEAWNKRYEAYKHQLGVIDYDDMERGLRTLLQKESVRQEIAKRYKLVMVDEFQDCNPIQLQIFEMLSDIVAEGSPLAQSSIWVGDPKQAIYGFRGSDTELIERVARHFPPVDSPADQNGCCSSSLRTSYRTREPLVSLTNNLFDQPIRFEGMTRLSSHRGRVAGMRPEAVELWKIPGRYDKDRAPVMARQLKQVVEQGDYYIVPKDATKKRPLDYGDIAILCATNSHVEKVAEALRTEEVPVWAPETEIVNRAEVQLVLSLLHLTDKKGQSHEWASLLKLWCDNTTEQVLSKRLEYLRSKDPAVDDQWYESLPELAPIHVALKHAKGLPLDERMTALILELGLYERVVKWGNPETRRQNLKTLQQCAITFISRCQRLHITPGTKEFVQFLSETKVQKSKIMPQGMVKVLTYHGSKGLEWPMVVLYSLDHQFVNDDTWIDRLLLGVREQVINYAPTQVVQHYRLQYLPPASGDPLELIKQSGVSDWDCVREAQAKSDDEALRLLYVGITRARDFLILPVEKDGNGAKEQHWLNTVGMKLEDFNPMDLELRPFALKAPKEPELPKPRARQKTKDEYPEKKRQYEVDLEAYNQEKALRERRLQPKDCYWPLLPELQELKRAPRYLQPSRLPRPEIETDVPKKIAVISKGTDVTIEVSDGEENQLDKSSLGTCIHNIFAACPSSGQQPSVQEIETYAAMAQLTLENCGLSETVKQPRQLAEALYALHQWLTEKYGPATKGIEKEYPFSFAWRDGQVIRGEIDMIWRTDQGDVIIDFKNHVDDDDSIAIGAPCPHSNCYVSQLCAYRQILEKSGRKVLATLLYYDLKGYLVEVR